MCVCVFVKGMKGFYGDGTVNYSFQNSVFLAYNPIVNALLASQLDMPVVYAINSESISPFGVAKKCPMNTQFTEDSLVS